MQYKLMSYDRCTGKIYSNFDIKWSYVSCVALFEIGSAICGAAPSMSVFLVGRTICGLGGSGMYTGVMTILSCLSSPTERPAYLGLTGLSWGLGTVLGPIIGGALAVSPATWRWGFYINLVFGGICAPVFIFLVPSIPGFGSGKFMSKILQLDWIGSTLIAGILISLLMGIGFGGVLYPWHSSTIIALFVLSGVLLFLFAVQQAYCIGTTEAARIFPVKYLRHRELSLLFAAELCATTLTFIPIYFTPLFFQFARSDSALDAGVRLLPLVMFLVVTIVGSGLVTARYPWYKPWFLVGSVFALTGAACLYSVDQSTTNAQIYGFSIMIGFGAGCFVTLCFAAAQTHVNHESIPLAVGFICFAQLAGSALTLAIANSVFLNEATEGILQILPSWSPANAQRIISGVGTSLVQSLSPSDRERITDVVITTLNKAYIIAIVCGGLAVVFSLLLKEKEVGRKVN